MWLAQTVGEGLAVGSGSILAAAVGSGDRFAARRAAAAGQSLAVWGSMVVLLAGLLLTEPIFAFMGTDRAVTDAGIAYLVVILLGMPAYFVFAWITSAFRAAGDAATALKLLAIAAFVNVVLDPLLIFGVGIFPQMGIAGAALATIVSWFVACVFGWQLLSAAGFAPRLLDFLKPPGESWRALRVGIPLGVEGALFSVIYIFLTRVTTTFGTPAVAALGVGHKIEVFNYFVCAGMGAAATTLVGQNLGAGAPDPRSPRRLEDPIPDNRAGGVRHLGPGELPRGGGVGVQHRSGGDRCRHDLRTYRGVVPGFHGL